MMKRTLALLLACILVLGQIPLISASALTAGERPPIDIPATITNIPTGYTVEPGTANTVDWSGVWDTLRPGQIWTDTSVYYPQTGGYYDGTAIITIYIWAKQFEKENGELGLLGDDSNITVETRMGHFSLYAVDYPLSTDDAVFYPPSAASDNEHITGVDFSRTDDRMRWSIDESHIIDEEAPFAIRYYLYLAPRDTWMIRFAYTTLGSELVVRFEPANDNPEYWTTVWVLYEAFSLQNVSWNNGNGMNSGFVTDNDLGITFQLGSNANGSYQNQTAESVSWSASNLANRVHWANNARNIATGQLYWWHLYWYSGSGTRNFVITIKDAYTDIDGNTQDRSYHIGVPGGGGNTSIPGDLVLSSEVPFRIPFPPDSPYRWDGDTGYLIFEAPLHAEIVLTDELWDTLQPKGNVIIEKQFPDFDFRDTDWEVNDSTNFTARLRTTDHAYFVFCEERTDLGQNQFVFLHFTDQPGNATTITFSVDQPATIYGLPRYARIGDTEPLEYEVYEFFEDFFQPRDWYLVNELINVEYAKDGGAFQSSFIPFVIADEEDFEVTITILNDFSHGIGFLAIGKALDGFPADWDVHEDTVFYVRIWDHHAQNYLLFDPTPVGDPASLLPPMHSRFNGTLWCVGNHELGLTDWYDLDITPIMDIPISVNNPVFLSNLWTWSAYTVVEVQRVGAAMPQDSAHPLTSTDWVDFWADESTRIPVWARGELDSPDMYVPAWASGFADVPWPQDQMDELMLEWVPIREIEDSDAGDAVWHDVRDWYWGVIYSPTNDPDHMFLNPETGELQDMRLRFNQEVFVAMTNRFMYHHGTLEFWKDLCDNAEDWGMDEETFFYARVRADDGRYLVFRPEPDGVYRVTGFIVLNEDGSDGAYTVLCPRGGGKPIDPLTGQARTMARFSATESFTLIEVPSLPFGPPITYTIVEVFPDGMPSGLHDEDIEILIYEGEGLESDNGQFTISHGQKFDVIITNNFIEYEGLFIINKEVIGQEPDLAHWGVDEDTLFYVGVQAVDSEEFLYFIQLSEDSNIFVYENAVGMEIPDGEPQFVIPISESTPAILVGLTTLYSNYAVIEFDDADGNELRYPSEIGFAAIIDGPTLDDGNLYATVLNIFMPGNYVIIDEGTLTISKLLDGDYEIFGIDETSEFFVGVMRDDSEDLLSFVYLADNVYVYVGSVNTKVPVGEPQIQISIFPGTDVVFLGLNIDYYDYLVFELEPDGTIIDTISEDGFFHSFVDGPDRDGDDLFVTITNTFFWVDGTGFRVFYHANGGDGDVPLDDAIYLEGDLVLVLSPDSLYRDGHTFIGWNTEPGGSGVWYLTGFVPFETEDEDSGTEAPVDDPSEAESPETEDEDSGADEPDDDNAFEMTYESLAPYALIGAPYALIDDGSFEMPGRHVTLYAQWQPVNGGSGNGSGGDNHTPPPPENYIPRVPPPIPRPAPGEFFIPQHIWYVRGDDNINMRPDANVTRAEVAMVFYRLLRPEWKLFEPDGTPFSDVAGDEWYGRAIGILANFGIVEGYDDGTFRPNAPISRKEFAAVVSRFDNLANTDNNPYTDLDPNDWAYRYILSATQKGWFIGYRDMFRPDAHLTRAEMVTAINRIFDRITLLEDVPDNVFRFLDLDESHWAYADFMEAAHTHTYQRRDINNTEVWIEIIETGLDAPYNR